jgi:TPP-dependent pyruvate/acetoin dehydrogenase alpha subunit
MTPGLDTRQMLEVHALLRLTRGVASRLAAVRRASRAGDSEPGGDVGRLVGARDPDAGYEPGCEAVAVGSAYALEEGDLVGPSRRDLGARLARGLTPRECFAEVLGREIGEAHAGDDDRSPRRPGGTGIVAGLGVAADLVSVLAGCALALRMQGRDRACLTFVEESATRAGGFHEGLNFAAVRKLPVIVVIENDAFPREDLDFNAAG